MIDNPLLAKGELTIKNITGSSYTVEELSGDAPFVLAPQATVNLMDHYRNWRTATRLDPGHSFGSKCTTAKLYQDIQAGLIEVVLNRPPVIR